MDKTASAEKAISLLKDGNARFVGTKHEKYIEYKQRRIQTSEEGQHPAVAILSCSDSRVPVELLFDCGIGEIFTVRVAGNTVGAGGLGSLEYAVEHLGVSVLLVMGHTQCGAVQAAIQPEGLRGSIGELVAKIAPTAEKVKIDNPGLAGPALFEAVVRANVWQSISDLLNKSSLIKESVVYGRVRLLGACYDIREGSVDWMGAHPEQWQLLARIP
jgi:carbonic anhydrase